MIFYFLQIDFLICSLCICQWFIVFLQMSRVMRKPTFCICENKDVDQLRGYISAFVFATQIVQSLFFLNTKFQASSYLLWLYSLVCVGPGRKPERWFSHVAAQMLSHEREFAGSITGSCKLSFIEIGHEIFS